MEMNKYLIAALYVVAGCVATLPINVRGGNVSVRTDCYRLLVSSTEKVITVSTEKRSTEDFDYGDFYNQSHAETVGCRKSLYYLLCLSFYRVGKSRKLQQIPSGLPGKWNDFGFMILDLRSY